MHATTPSVPMREGRHHEGDESKVEAGGASIVIVGRGTPRKVDRLAPQIARRCRPEVIFRKKETGGFGVLQLFRSSHGNVADQA